MLDVIKLTETYSATNIAPYPLAISEGNGIYVYDFDGKTYIDMASGIAVTNFGHKHPRLIKALLQQANKIAIVPRLFHNQPLSLLLASVCKLTNMEKALPMNSGAEATETAIKIARKWGYTVKNIPKDQAEIIVCDNSFHGRTVTTISMSSIAKYKENFGPLTPNFISIPFNDTAALQQAITANTAAFIVEPIQGEAGVIIPDDGYLKACETICKKNNVLFIIDEIQTGMGRTGKLLASQHENINPDGLLLGKALGGGLLPISLFLATNPLMQVIQPGEHGSTFGGNPLACSVAYEALNLLIDENICENSAALGHYFIDQLRMIKNPCISNIQGRGLFIAIELNTNKIKSRTVYEQLIQNGLLTVDTRNQFIRLLPPLIITQSQIDEAVKIIGKVFIDISEQSF